MNGVHFEVKGHAQPAGSKRIVPNKATHKPIVVDANPKAKAWKKVVWAAGVEAMVGRQRYEGPVRVLMIFYQQRPKSHYGTGRNANVLKDSAPLYPTGKPDALKLGRGVEDALTGVCWRDDAQIVTEALQKRYGLEESVAIWIDEA